MTMHGGHILGPEGTLRISLSGYGQVQELDLSGNYWGAVGGDQIPNLIHDHEDDPGLSATVVFLPMADEPLATQRISWGKLKADYR